MARYLRLLLALFTLNIVLNGCGDDDTSGGSGNDGGAGDSSIDGSTPPRDGGGDATLTDGGRDASDASPGPDAADASPATHAVGGTVSGLAGTGLVLQDNAGDNLAVSANGAFTFAKKIASGGAYAVTVLTQPSSPSQTCTVASGTGTVGNADVTNVTVTCVTAKHTVGGTVTGLSGTGLVLQNNGGDALPVSGNGPFTFATSVASGATYAVTVKTQPTGPAQVCSVSGGTGTVGTGNVTSVVVNCAANAFTVGGTISGLNGSVTLQNNGGNDLVLNANGTFAFSTPVSNGAAYAVTVKTQPASPAQTCTVAGGTGTMGSANVTSVVVTCTTNKYAVGGSVTGLATGATLVLQDNGGDNFSVTQNGPFSFPAQVASGAAYAVTVLTQPSSPSQTCAATSATGTVGSAAVTSVVITCTTNKYTVGGTVVGLASGASLTIQNSGGDDKTINANGPFTFATAVASGAAYTVTVSAQPSSPVQTCVVSAGTGTVGSGNVTGVVVNCATDSYTVGGTITGLAGTVVLQDNGGDDLTLNANGGFAFATPVKSGDPYAVTVKTQPGNPVQVCTVSTGTGSVAGANITSVTVSCTTTPFNVGGTLAGLAAGASVILQNNAGDNLTLTADGPFQFATPIASGAAYSVTVLAQPDMPSQTCVVANGSGNVGASDVTTVSVVCTTNTFTIGGNVSGLVGSGLVLQDNGGNDLAIAADGAFVFSTPVASGGAYAVTIATQPTNPTQTCAVSAGTGTVTNGNVTGVTVNCNTNNYTVGGTISGLAGSVVLQNNAGDDLTLTTNGSFSFATAIPSGSAYAVTVKTQPASPPQTCTVTNGSGTIGGAPVTSVSVTCVTKTFTVGGTLTGLASAGTLVLRNNGGNDLSLTTSGSFTFTTAITSGNPYAVTIATQPTGAYCTLSNGSGTVTSANITSVSVSCTVASGATCSAIKAANSAAANGTYVINPTGTSSFPAYCDMTSTAGGWTEVYDQDIRVSPGYRSTATWLAGVNTTSPNSGQYSILNLLDALKGGARFQFRLEWTDTPNAGYVEWQQVENPTSTSAAPTISGVVMSPTGQTGCSSTFSGLALGDTGFAALDGDRVNGCWWWAVGTTSAYVGGIPGYAGVNQGTPRARLFVRTATPSSCKDVKALNGAAASGTYSIDVDGSGPIAAINAYCDLTYNDGNGAGGWTLIEVIQPPNGPTSGLTQGTPAPGGSTYLPVATVQALAAISTQVHIRTPGLASTQSVTSLAGTAPIVHLRAGQLVDQSGDPSPEHNLWTGPYADATHLDFTCANYNLNWPNVYQACGTNGMHIWQQHARWAWSGGDATQNTAFEIYAR